MSGDLPRIASDNDWLSLHEGDEGLTAGRLDYAGGTTISIAFADWSILVIDSDDAARLAPLKGQTIELVVTRTEDGVYATADAVTDCLVQHGSI